MPLKISPNKFIFGLNIKIYFSKLQGELGSYTRIAYLKCIFEYLIFIVTNKNVKSKLNRR